MGIACVAGAIAIDNKARMSEPERFLFGAHRSHHAMRRSGRRLRRTDAMCRLEHTRSGVVSAASGTGQGGPSTATYGDGHAGAAILKPWPDPCDSRYGDHSVAGLLIHTDDLCQRLTRLRPFLPRVWKGLEWESFLAAGWLLAPKVQSC
jgi:hypothetical protein